MSNASRLSSAVFIACALGASAPIALAGEACLADLNGDGVVNHADLITMLANFGDCDECNEDLNGNGAVDTPDLAFLLESWGPCPPGPVPGDTELFTDVVGVDATDADAASRGLTVTHVYATGPLAAVGDSLLLAGEADIQAGGATLFQHLIGGDQPPSAALIEFFPDLAYDSFVAMNVLVDDQNTNPAPDFSMDTKGLSGGWFAVPTTDQREAVDIGKLTGNPGQAGVLIAQMTLVCAGDTDGSGTVDTVDLLALLAAWGTTVLHPPNFDGDTVVGTNDLLILLAGWGECPPSGLAGTITLYTSAVDGGTLDGAETVVEIQFEP